MYGRCVGRLVYRACRFDTRGDGDGDGGDGGERNTLLIPNSRFRQIRAFHSGERGKGRRGGEDLDNALRSPRTCRLNHLARSVPAASLLRRRFLRGGLSRSPLNFAGERLISEKENYLFLRLSR